jgi:glycosyltransferase involved in cell wall biosynthesis
MRPTISVIIPAFNEEKYLPKTLEAIRRAECVLGEDVEIVVGDNLSSDDTVQVAERYGAKIVRVETKCISAVRNQAAAKASGRFLAFVDADDIISENLLLEVRDALSSNEFIGGGVAHAGYERNSFGIKLTHSIVMLNLKLRGLSMWVFYTTPDRFRELGGFDEQLLTNEDIDFAVRLKRLGKRKGLKYCNLQSVDLTKSCRKFDQFGDWFVFTHPIKFLKAFFNDREAADFFWYRPNR